MLQMRGFSHRGSCEKSLEGNDMSLEGNGGLSGGVPHAPQRSAQASLGSIGSEQSEGSDPLGVVGAPTP